MLDQKIFGEKLRNHRKKLGMTQEEVAEKGRCISAGNFKMGGRRLFARLL